MEFKPDQVLAHYRLIEKIGAGGMGVVWSALDTKLKRNVAIKILPPDITADAERRLRFQREAETAAGLSHPNIAVIHEVGEHDGAPFLVMELLKGKTLRDAVGTRALPTKEWLGYGLAIASALAHAHKSGVVHRDLKSSNVMVTDDGHVKLLDFGLAKLLDPPADGVDDDAATRMETISRELTRAGTVLGTVAYMSPEQARGDTIDHRSDIFSFGVLLYELVSGNLPFKGKTDIESLSATLSFDPRPISEIAGDTPTEVERIVAKALEKEPERRYQTADDMVTDFRNLKRDLDTGRVSITGATGTVTRPASNTGATHTAGPAPKRVKPWMIGVVAAVALIAATVGIMSRRSDDSTGVASGDRAGTSTQSGGGAAATSQPTSETTRIVVLPFENLGAAEDEYFASGVTEEIIGRLASVRDLAVISRSSAFQYDRSGKSMQQIGNDFDVDYVLDGTVRWARSGETSRVRISPQLVRVSNDTGVWGETYDSDMDDIFQVQTDMAGKVIDALGVVLVAGERESLETKPTENQDAYQAYMRGQDALAREPTSGLAQQMLERAVELDPTFHQAWAWLSRAHSWRYHGGDRAGNHCESAKAAADEALRLAPGAPEPHMALGLYYYRCFRDYRRGLAEIEIAGRDRPNDTDVLSWKATMNKRQGNLEESLRLYQRVQHLDPMDHTAAQEIGVVNMFYRRYADAIAGHELAKSISPDIPDSYYYQTRVYVRWKDGAGKAREAIADMPPTDHPRARWYQFDVEYYDGQYETALAIAEALPEYFEDQTTLHVRAAKTALCYDMMGDAARAGAARDQAVALLQKKVDEDPSDFRPYSDLGPILAALGRRDEAIAAATRGAELMPLSKDAEAGAHTADNLALTYAILGDDAAVKHVEERLQAIPGLLTIPLMRLDPRWRGFVARPEFEELARRLDIYR